MAPLPLRRLSGWGRTAPSSAHVAEPGSVDELAHLLTGATGRGAIARGLGRSYGDVAQNAGGLVIDTTRLNRVLALDEETGVLTAEAGCSLDQLIDHALPHGWFLPVTPGTSAVTLGGAIAADVHGKNHHRDGAFGRHVTELTLVTPDGDELRLTPSDAAFGATAGGLGLTGIVARCSLQLLRVESAWTVVETVHAQDVDDLVALLADSDREHRYSVAWVDARSPSRRAVVTQGDHAAPDEVPPQARTRPLERRRGLQVPAPPAPAAGLLRSRALSAYNDLRFRRAHAGRSLETLDAFFYPLDGVKGWNRLYGRDGLVQYQYLVPLGAEDVVREIFTRVERLRPVLVVFKRFGEEAGPLSFPMPGWTVAIDFIASTEGLARALDEVDERVASAGGRVYLAKDARLAPAMLPRMYPRLDEWRAARSALDPGGRMQGDLARRLGLTRV